MPAPLGFHITLRLEGDRNLAPTTAARRLFARTILTVARPFVLLTFRWTDTHGHLEMLGTRAEAGELARRVQIALQHALRPGAPFVPAHFTPMMSLGHVKSTFRYVLGQREHHGLGIDPHHDASNGPDLLEARTIGAWTTVHVEAHLPRFTRVDILAALHLDEPATAGPADLSHLPDAAAAAVGLSELDRSAAARPARVAAIQVALELGAADVPASVGIAPRSFRRLRAKPADPAIVRAIHQQLAMRRTHESIDTLAVAE